MRSLYVKNRDVVVFTVQAFGCTGTERIATSQLQRIVEVSKKEVGSYIEDNNSVYVSRCTKISDTKLQFSTKCCGEEIGTPTVVDIEHYINIIKCLDDKPAVANSSYYFIDRGDSIDVYDSTDLEITTVPKTLLERIAEAELPDNPPRCELYELSSSKFKKAVTDHATMESYGFVNICGFYCRRIGDAVRVEIYNPVLNNNFGSFSVTNAKELLKELSE